MSKIKLLLNVVEDMRNLADSLQDLCDVMMSNEERLSNSTSKEQDTEAVQSESNKEKSQKTPVEPTPTISLEEVRGVLAKKAQDGKQAEVRELTQSYGVDRLSEVDVTYYEELMKKAEVL